MKVWRWCVGCRPIERTRRIGRWVASQGPLVLAVLILSTGALLSGITTLIDERNERRRADESAHHREQLEFEQSCRFELATPQVRIQADKLDAMMRLIVAAITEDEPAIQMQLERIARLQVDEEVALEQRESAVAECDRRAEVLFG